MKLRVKEIARSKKIQLKTIAEKMNISYVRLHAVLNQDNLETKTLENIADALGCELIELLEPNNPELTHIYNRDSGEWLGIKKIT